MDKLASLKFNKVLLNEQTKNMYVDLMKNNTKLLKVLKIIKDNTVYSDNPGKIGTTKEMIMDKNISKFHTDNIISYMLGASFIYYDTKFESKGRYYSLTIRGTEIYLELVKGGYIND